MTTRGRRGDDDCMRNEGFTVKTENRSASEVLRREHGTTTATLSCTGGAGQEEGRAGHVTGPVRVITPGSDGQLAVRVRGLAKSYGDLTAVGGIDFDIRRGEILALLGPNGAGKTTTVEILEGYRSRSAGDVEVLGYDPGRERTQLKRRIGVVLQSTGVEPYLTVRETVAMYARLYPSPRPVDEAIDLVGLTKKRGERVNRLSGGQQRRLDMAIALSGDPELLFLDEPTTGFDPAARREAWEVVKNLASLGKTVLLTTHFMDEAQYLAERVVVIANGRIVAEGTPATLGFRDQAKVLVRYRIPAGVVPPAGLGGPRSPEGFVEVSVEDAVTDVHRLLQWAIDDRVDLDGLEVTRPSLEDVYLALTNSVTSELARSDSSGTPGRRS